MKRTRGAKGTRGVLWLKREFDAVIGAEEEGAKGEWGNSEGVDAGGRRAIRGCHGEGGVFSSVSSVGGGHLRDPTLSLVYLGRAAVSG